EEVLAVAERNLSLLTPAGVERRMAAFGEMAAAYGKASHQEALASAATFRSFLLSRNRPIQTRLFAADATDGPTLARHVGKQVDMVIADVPYGWHTAWQGDTAGQMMTPVQRMLEALRPLLGPGGVVAIAADKQQKIQHEAYRRLERFQVGKRQVVLLRPIFD